MALVPVMQEGMVLAPEIVAAGRAMAPYLEKALIADAMWQQSRPYRARLGSYAKGARGVYRSVKKTFSKKKGKINGKRSVNPKLKARRYKSQGLGGQRAGGVLSLATRRFRKPLRPMRVGKSVVLVKDQTGQFTAPSTGWIGFQHHDSYDAMLRAACEGLAQAILAVLKVYPDGQDEAIVIDGLRSFDTPTLKIDYQNVALGNGADSERTDSISMVGGGNADTFKKLVDFMLVDFKTNVEDGFYPLKFSLELSQANEPTVYLHRDVDISNAAFYLCVKQRVDLQNQSKAATSGTAGHEDVANRLNIHSQPLKGKMYSFKHSRADVHDNVHKEHAYLDFFETTQPTFNGINGISGGSVASSSHLIAHPPVGRQVFKNLDKEGHVSLAPGEVKKHYTTFKFSGTLKTFISKLTSNATVSIERKPFGGITWFCLERAIKHGDTEAEVAFNRQLKIYSYVKIRHQRHQLKRTEG